MQDVWQDIRFGIRSWLRKPAFLIVAVLSLTLGIGTNTALFSLLDGIFLRPLPQVDTDGLAMVYTRILDQEGRPQPGPENLVSLSYPNVRDLAERTRTFSGLAVFQWHPVHLLGVGEPTRAIGMFVSKSYFDLLRVEPARGRFFTPGEQWIRGGDPVLVLTYESWQRLFGGDPSAIGRTVNVNNRELEIIGVGPRGFKGTNINVDVDFWIPITMYPEIAPYAAYFDVRGISLFNVFGRLRPGVALEQARAELAALGEQLVAEHPQDNEQTSVTVRPFLEGTINPPVERDAIERYRKVLLAAVVLVLLAACFNVAVLLLVRGRERARELAMRQAVGARRGRLIRQLLTENLLLFLLGGVLSLPVARWSLDLLWRFRPVVFAEDAVNLRLDAMVLSFAFALALVTGLIFGLLPAWRVSRLDLVAQLKSGTHSDLARRSRPRLRDAIVAIQVAAALVALMGAGLAQRNLRAATEIDLGFAYRELASLTLAPGEQGYDPERARALYRRLIERAEALPGVRAATLSENRLLRGAVMRTAVTPEGEENPSAFGGRFQHRINTVVPGFFETAGIPLLRGRDFDPRIDVDGAPRVVIINRTMAEALWPGQDAVGKRVLLGPSVPGTPTEVIGVVADARYRHVREDPQFFLYLPLGQSFAGAMTLHVRTAGDPAAVLPALRELVRDLDPNLTLADVDALAEFVDTDLWAERMSATLLTVFGVLALALAVVGVYGVVSYAASLRHREFGIRFAVGARRGDVLRAVIGGAALRVGVGLLLGFAVAVPLYHLVSRRSQLFLEDVNPADPTIYLLYVLALVAAALAGSLWPAWRASRTDPQLLLHTE